VPFASWVAVPRSFDVSTDTPASVEEIHSAFSDEQYWLARLAAYGGDTMTLDTLVVDADGTVAVATTQDLRHELLPGVLAKVFPGDLTVLRKEIWRPIDGRRIHANVSITASGVPASGVGSAVLAPIAEGSRLRFAGTLEVRIPLVGGRIEKYIGGQIAEEIPEVQRFTTNWISANA
jgi:Protein of unknown function (DUF2505)